MDKCIKKNIKSDGRISVTYNYEFLDDNDDDDDDDDNDDDYYDPDNADNDNRNFTFGK